MFLNPLMISVMVLVSAATFAVLPQSRRQAKVKWAHLIRIALYGIAMPMPVILLMPIAACFAEHGLFLTIANTAAVVGLAIVAFQFVWWSFASGRYLHMSKPWAVGAAVWFVGLLATITVVLWISLTINT